VALNPSAVLGTPGPGLNTGGHRLDPHQHESPVQLPWIQGFGEEGASAQFASVSALGRLKWAKMIQAKGLKTSPRYRPFWKCLYEKFVDSFDSTLSTP